MTILIDLIVIAIFAFYITKGYKKGFAITLVDTFSYVFALVFTGCTYKHVVPYVSSSAVGTFISESIKDIITNAFANQTDALVGSLNLPFALMADLSESTLVLDAASTLSSNITNALITLLTVVLIFIVVRILLKLLKGPIRALSSIPVIKQINTLAGVVLGAIAATFWIYVLMAVIGMFTFIPFISDVSDMILSSSVASIFYLNNPILSILK